MKQCFFALVMSVFTELCNVLTGSQLSKRGRNATGTGSEVLVSENSGIVVDFLEPPASV
jgi:hypothetical protein